MTQSPTRTPPASERKLTGPEVLAALSPRRSKYGVDQSEHGRAARTLDGVLYDSKFEAEFAAMLVLRKRTGDIIDWWRQVKFPLRVNGHLICTYIADFKVLDKKHNISWIDVKGYSTPAFRLKMKLLEAIYPEVRLTIVRAK